jgi:hypothetical protein
MPRARALAGGAAAAAVLALVGCGDGEAEQLGPEQLRAQADELCRAGQERFAEIQAQAPSNSAEALAQTDELIDVAEDELSELRSLRPPEELRDAYDAYLVARGRALELMKEGRDSAQARDADGYAEAQAKVAADSGARAKLATAAGLRSCSATPGAGER